MAEESCRGQATVEAAYAIQSLIGAQTRIVDSLFLGIVSGLLTTFLVFGLLQVWTKIIYPWLQRLVYRDASIIGTWYALVSDGEDNFTELWQIRQNAHRIAASITCTSGPDQGKTYTFKGTFKNLILTGDYALDSRTSIDRGTVTFMLRDNGEQLLGKSAFYYDHEHSVDTVEYDLSRKPPDDNVE